MFGIYENRLACRLVQIGILSEQRSSGTALLKRLSKVRVSIGYNREVYQFRCDYFVKQRSTVKTPMLT
jgi:hypothetical protein